ncbi:MAG: DUF664 domain-containing protein [Kurthia sp.]|nr:DUF664 domain-containing protein [Candidatus Kurthia equi]
MNKQDYAYIKQSRQLILEQCKDLTEAEFTQVHGFALNSVKDTLIHMTKCYRNWVGSYLLGNSKVGDYPVEEVAKMTLADIEKLFALVDSYVYEAIEKYEDAMDTLMDSTSAFKADAQIQRTPHHILLHAFTHEFHHKGQVTAMFHLMGHKPRNTNMIEFESIS